MSEASFASLSPTLLARKGGARPAMRPQNPSEPASGKAIAASLEDLGWDDMGDDDGTPGQIVSLKPGAAPGTDVRSPVRETIERIAQKLEAPATRNAGSARGATATVRKKRAAFTLRLDPQRHLKLRLACTVHGKSAQALVTDALDALLATMPEIDNLAAQVSRD